MDSRSFTAIDGFVANSGFRDFMLELFSADKNEFNNAYKDFICQAADARNLLSYVSELDCETSDPLASIPPSTGTSGLSSGTGSKGSSDRAAGGGGGGCGVISQGNSTGGGPLSTLMIIILPLIVCLIYRSGQVRMT